MKGKIKAVNAKTVVVELEKAVEWAVDESVNIDLAKDKRSLDANAYFHILVDKIAKAQNIDEDQCKVMMNLQYGTIARDEKGLMVGVMIPASVDITKIYKYAKWYQAKEMDGKDYNCYIFYKETHTLTVDEMHKLLCGVVQEAEDLGIETKPPAEVERLASLL